VLAVAAGRSFAQAAVQAGLRSPSTVAHLVERFHLRGLAALTIAAGRGRKPTYDGTARVQIVATAQQPPARRQDGTATWSLLTLERCAAPAGAFPAWAPPPSAACSKDAGSSYQRTRTWCPTGNGPAQAQRAGW